MSVNSNLIYLDEDDCGASEEYIPGPATGSISITAYAFAQGQDKWLGSNCKGQAQASQANIVRYGTTSPGGEAKHWIIPSKSHKAQIVGCIDSSYCYMRNIFYEGTTANSQVMNGVSITTQMSNMLGSELVYTGFPMPITIPNLNPFRITEIISPEVTAYISSININVDFPNPATINYVFDFLFPDCANQAFQGGSCR